MALVVPNFARTTLRAAISPSSLQLLLATGGGAYFEIGTGNYMYITLEDGQSVEIVKYTSTGAIVNDTLTVERGQDGTTAKSFPAGTCVKVAWNVQQLQDLITQTFIDLFNSSVLPPNTIQVSSAPVAAPPANVIYAVWYAQKQFWYWNGTSWIELGNPRNGVLAGSGDPSGTPDNIVAFYVDLDSGALWYWPDGGPWLQIAGTSDSSEEYWVKTALGASLYTLVSDTQVELGVITTTDRYRTYPNGVPANTILQVQIHGGAPRITLLEAAAMEVAVTVRGHFDGATPDSVMELIITNSYNDEWAGNSATVNSAFGTDIVLSASTGVLTWPAGTYFDGNLAYSQGLSGPWPNFIIEQVAGAFHVVEAGVGPP
jgi:hypothetical protein